MLQPHEILMLLALAIWIDGLWLCKVILWKKKPKSKTVTIKAKKEGKVASLSDLGYSDPWKEDVI